MAKIKGLELEAKVDVSKLKKALKDVNGDLRDTAQQGRALDKALKVDPDNLELAEKKADQLRRQIELTEDKAKLLQKELETVGDDVDPRKVIKLETAILNAETEAKKLKQQLGEVTEDVENDLDLGLDDEAGKVDSITNSVGGLTSGFSSSSEAAGLVGGEIAGIAGSMGPWGAAIAGAITTATGAFSIFLEQLKEAKEAQADLLKSEGFDRFADQDFQFTETVVNDRTGELMTLDVDINDVIKQFSDLYEIPKEEARAYAVVASKVFKDNIKDAYDLNTAMELIATSTRNIGVDEGLSVINSAQQTWNLTNEESLVLLDNLDNRIGILGKRAEDLPDTILEWGDTFSTAGVNANELLDFLDIGLIAGAQNSDKLADSFNEFLIKVGDGTQATRDAFSSLGLSYDDYVAKIENGEAVEAYYEVANAISSVVDPQERLNIAGQIYGTQGEELVATTLANADAQSLLNLQLAQRNLAETEYELAQKRKFGNLTAEEEQLLQNTIAQEKQNLAIAEAGFVTNDLNNKVDSLASQYAISEEQATKYKEAIAKLSDPSVSFAEKQTILNGELSGFINAANIADGSGTALRDTLYEISATSSNTEGMIYSTTDSMLGFAESNGTLTESGRATINMMNDLGEGSSETGQEVINLSNNVRDLNTGLFDGLAFNLDYTTENLNFFGNEAKSTAGKVDEAKSSVKGLKNELDKLPSSKRIDIIVNETTNRSIRQANAVQEEAQRSIRGNVNINQANQGIQGTLVTGNTGTSNNNNINLNITAQTTNPKELAEKIADPLVRILGERS